MHRLNWFVADTFVDSMRYTRGNPFPCRIRGTYSPYCYWVILIPNIKHFKPFLWWPIHLVAIQTIILKFFVWTVSCYPILKSCQTRFFVMFCNVDLLCLTEHSQSWEKCWVLEFSKNKMAFFFTSNGLCVLGLNSVTVQCLRHWKEEFIKLWFERYRAMIQPSIRYFLSLCVPGAFSQCSQLFSSDHSYLFSSIAMHNYLIGCGNSEVKMTTSQCLKLLMIG